MGMNVDLWVLDNLFMMCVKHVDIIYTVMKGTHIKKQLYVLRETIISQ